MITLHFQDVSLGASSSLILFFGQTYSDAGNNANFAFKRCLSITIKQRNSLVYTGLYWYMEIQVIFLKTPANESEKATDLQ